MRTVEELQLQSCKNLLQCMQSVIQNYNARGFQVQHLRAENKFECLTESICPVLSHITAKNEHVPEVERSIPTVKERVRSEIHTLPFEYYPKLMLSHLILHSVNLLNMFPAKTGVSDTLSPHTIMTGLPQPIFKNFSLRFES